MNKSKIFVRKFKPKRLFRKFKPKRLFRKFKPLRSFRKFKPKPSLPRPKPRGFYPIPPADKLNYANVSLISKFISQQGKILSKRMSGLTLKEQRLITIAIKQARILGLLPFRNNSNVKRLNLVDSKLKDDKQRKRKKFPHKKKFPPKKFPPKLKKK